MTVFSIKQYGLLLLTGVLALGCSVKPFVIPAEEEEPELVSMTFKAYPETPVKTSLGEDYGIRWSTTDQVSLFSSVGTQGAVFTVDETEAEGAVATFTGLTPLSSVGYYYAVYPAQNSARLESAEGIILADIPTTQTGALDSFADGANLSVARVNADAPDDAHILRFKNVGALLSFTVPGNYISRIKIQSRNPEVAMTGRAHITYNNVVPQAEASTTAKNYVEVTVPEQSMGKRYYATVYPGNYDQGFIVTFYTSSGAFNRYTSSKALNLERNGNVRLIEKNWGVNDDRSTKSVSGTELIAPVISSSAASAASSTISFSCGSGVRDRYYFYVRNYTSMGSGTKVGELYTGASDYTSHDYTFTGLSVGTTYDLGVGAVREGYQESVTWLEDVTITTSVSGLYSWEQDRGTLPVPADVSLIYGGSEDRNPFEWTQDRWQHHVSYVDGSSTEHWLFDAFLCSESALYDGNWAFTLVGGNGTYSGTRAKWERLLDYWFSGGSFKYQTGYWNADGWNAYNSDWGALVPTTLSCGALDNLEACIAATAARIGAPPSKRYVIIGLPEPIYYKNYYRGCRGEDMGENFTSTTYWGEILGDQLDFSDPDQRVRAVTWYMDQIRQRFFEKNYQYIELLGFYILEESLSTTNGSYRNELKKHQITIPQIAEHAHACNEGLYWIPYAGAESYNKWASLGFDQAWYQPNYYFNPDKSLASAITAIQTYGMGMELELSHTVVADLMGDGADAYRTRLQAYLDQAQSSGIYGTKPLAVFSSTNAWSQLATSTDPRDQALFQTLCEFLLGSALK